MTLLKKLTAVRRKGRKELKVAREKSLRSPRLGGDINFFPADSRIYR